MKTPTIPDLPFTPDWTPEQIEAYTQGWKKGYEQGYLDAKKPEPLGSATKWSLHDDEE